LTKEPENKRFPEKYFLIENNFFFILEQFLWHYIVYETTKDNKTGNQ
jgi:hypothetical protein